MFLVVYVAGGRYVVVSEEELEAILREISALKAILAVCLELLRGHPEASSRDFRYA